MTASFWPSGCVLESLPATGASGSAGTAAASIVVVAGASSSTGAVVATAVAAAVVGGSVGAPAAAAVAAAAAAAAGSGCAAASLRWPLRPLVGCGFAFLHGGGGGPHDGRRQLHLWRRAASAEAPAGMATETADGPWLARTEGETDEKEMAAAGFVPVLHSFSVFVAPSPVHGWGVFAGKDFVLHELVHESPGRLLRGAAREVRDDIFELGWDEPNAGNMSILGLGFASLHNHATDPNVQAQWERSERHGGRVVGIFFALRDVKQGEELFISYGEEWWTSRRVAASNQTGTSSDT
mmetsp:Transcript_3122/g.12133  ORF Transcript_3122/g.12133 Transcript_3122/m.12133 type:complete len:295 (-) Transcript_3122:187-1071(-)